MRLIPLFLTIGFLCTTTVQADDEPPITPAEAATRVGQKVVVKMEVKSSGGMNNHYLNSEADYKDAKNFTVFISKDHLDKFKMSGVMNPSQHYKGKVIQVTGVVTLEKAKDLEPRPWIKVQDPDQIKVITKENP